ncbi:MAG: phosphomannomutase/phosphoglucomutase [Gemmatimonadota bacterium]|nr:MAG: phosphomannomutase/phosphoglucomutase [Gemmatimonadota bacterium]
MDIPAVIFRQYDIRGVVGEDLSPQVAHAVGRALGTLARHKIGRDPRLAVGRDNRPSGELLARAMRDGVAAAGGTAIDVGMLPTPALYFALHELEVDGGVQVTGSHNPPEFNGFKMVITGETIYGDEIQRIRQLIETDQLDSAHGTIEADYAVLQRYSEAVVSIVDPLERPVKVVVDCGNGVASLVAESILTRLGADVVSLYCESDGNFPNHHPDPTVIENLKDLQESVRRTGAYLGIAFDGDGDRIGAVDENGKVVFGDQLLVLFGRDLVDRTSDRGAVIFDVKCSNILAEKLRDIGLEPVIWKTGHSLIKAKMKELQSPLAGEMSGHMFFGGDYYGYDDAIFAAARLLSYVARKGVPLSPLLKDLPQTFATPEIRVECPEDRKFTVVEEAAKHFAQSYDVLTLDGARISFSDGWGLIRASNTQPALVMRFEASTEQGLAHHRAEVEDWLRSQGISGL